MRILVALWLVSISAFAAPREGVYRRQGGMGSVAITKVSGTGLDFNVGTVNYQTNVCDIEGHADAKDAKFDYAAKAKTDDEKCHVTLDFPTPDTVNLGGECAGLCGWNATFDGEFKLAPDKCEEKGRKANKAEFDKLYKAKKYKEALVVRQVDLKECDYFLNVFDRGWLMSDLAVAAHHAGDDKACLEYLDGLEKSGATELETPMYQKDHVKLKRAMKTNRALCKKTKS